MEKRYRNKIIIIIIIIICFQLGMILNYLTLQFDSSLSKLGVCSRSQVNVKVRTCAVILL